MSAVELILRFPDAEHVNVAFAGDDSGPQDFKIPLGDKDRSDIRWYIETIAVSGFGILELGHGYFAEAGPVIDDIREAIAERRPAAQRAIPRATRDHFAIDIGTVDP